MFQYDEKNNCYSVEKHNMILSCGYEPDKEMETYGKLLIVKYSQALKSIAQYICRENEFIELYGSYTVEQTLKMLEQTMTIPWIFLKSSSEATIAYCNEDYVIEFEFEGCYTKFKNLEISS